MAAGDSFASLRRGLALLFVPLIVTGLLQQPEAQARRRAHVASNLDSLNIIERDRFIAPVVQLGRLDVAVPCNLGRALV